MDRSQILERKPVKEQNISLKIDNVTVAYGKLPVIEDISLDIKQGEFFGLMGVNGAGKTTLIKTILGLREQQSGEVKILDHGYANKLAKSEMAYLPERFEPPWFLTGIEFIQFSLELYGQKIDSQKVKKFAENLALEPSVLKNRVQTYSKGMRQKLGLLATILTDCSLLILDEPMSGLDPMARSLVKDMLIEGKSHNQSIFLSSHILADMEELCDRLALLHEGLIQFVGTPEELKKKTGSDNLERAFLHFIEKKGAA